MLAVDEGIKKYICYIERISYVQICIKEPDELANSLRYQGDNITI